MVVVDMEDVVGVGAQGRGALLAKRDPPTSHFLRGQRYDLLTLDQTYGAVFTAASDYIRDTPPSDADPAVDNYGEFQGTIKLTHTQNDSDCGAIRE